jgi:nucleotide-binding universal stress UspA family protein
MVFLQAGVPEGLITTKVRIGIPHDGILEEAEEEDYNLIIKAHRVVCAERSYTGRSEYNSDSMLPESNRCNC